MKGAGVHAVLSGRKAAMQADNMQRRKSWKDVIGNAHDRFFPAPFAITEAKTRFIHVTIGHLIIDFVTTPVVRLQLSAQPRYVDVSDVLGELIPAPVSCSEIRLRKIPTLAAMTENEQR